MHGNDWDIAIVLIVCTACLAAITGLYVGEKESSRAVVACEKSLPRDQKCVIIAVPETTLKAK